MHLTCRIGMGICSVVGSVLGIATAADAQPIGFSAAATARYQGGVDASQSLSVVNPGNLVPVTADALSDPSGDGFSFAQARAEGELNALGATLRSFSYASGANPNFDPPREVRASAAASASTRWVSQSQTLSPGTPIRINFLVPISGSLSVEEFFGATGPNDVVVEASAELLANGTLLYSGSARAYDRVSELGSTLSTSGAWDGDFTIQPLGTFLTDQDAFLIDTVDVVSINANLGDMFDVEFLLETSAFSIGPFETVAIADFSSTGSFELSAVDPNSGAAIDVTFVNIAIPEPGTAWLCWLGVAIAGTGLARRRSRA